MNRLLLVIPALLAAGCLSIKTESEIKPIHITMDVNLKVDKALDKAFADENLQKPQGDFTAVKRLVDAQLAGFTRLAMLEPRANATDDDRITIAEENAKRLRRFSDIAKSSGVKLEAVQKRQAGKLREKLPAGCWIQNDNGVWEQKK